jgi:hypothetical protein
MCTSVAACRYRYRYRYNVKCIICHRYCFPGLTCSPACRCSLPVPPPITVKCNLCPYVTGSAPQILFCYTPVSVCYSISFRDNANVNLKSNVGRLPSFNRQLAVLRYLLAILFPGEGINNNAGIPENCDPGADSVYTV